MARTAASLLLFLVCSVIVVHHGSAVCSVDVNSADMPRHQPLLVKSGTSTDFSSLLAPDASGNITVAAGTQLLAACPDSEIKILQVQSVQATCAAGTEFSVDGTRYTLNTLKCTQLPKSSVQTTSVTCGTDPVNHKLVQVGFKVEDTTYKLYEVCFDSAQLTPLYTIATVIGGIKGFQESFPRPKNWEMAGLYKSVDMTNQYKTQRDTLLNLLGALPADMGSNYLSKGHLAAKADFALGVQQSATFFYANSAPQWYGFNTGNWNQLELDVRSFATQNNFDLQVYTGTYGTLKLKNQAGSEAEIYLYASTSEKLVPVPMLFWKIVYEPTSKKAMVFLGVNNPFYSSSQLPAEYKLCEDVCSRVNWLHWKPTNQTSGLAYCCEYGKFKEKVTYAPLLDTVGSFSSSGAEASSALKLVTIFCSLWLLLRQSWN